ncbi:MAG: IS3 family transposase, partial [Treponema porcinum]|nr:IS3 family transposase [Treponema porcinum]
VYLMAIIDWFSRKVLSWRVFNTMDALQYANLLRETIEEYGCPAIFNTIITGNNLFRKISFNAEN